MHRNSQDPRPAAWAARRAPARWVVGAALLALLALGLGAAPARAGDEGDPDSYRAFDVGDGRLSLDVQDALFGQVIRERVQPRTSVNLVVSPEAEAEKVTIKLVDLHWVLVLDILTKRMGGVLVRKAPTLLQIERPAPVTMDYNDAPAREVISAIAASGGASIFIAEDIGGNVTLSLKNVPWRAALESAIKTLKGKYALVEDDYGVLRIVPADRLEKEDDYYRFKYLRPHAPYKGVIAPQSGGSGSGGGGSSGSGGGGSGSGQSGANVVKSNVYVPSDDPAEAEKNFPIVDSLRQIVQSEGGNVKYMPDQNTILYSGIRPKVQLLRRIAEQLDVEPPQVFVSMNFIVTSCQNAINLGLDAGDTTGFGMGLSGGSIFHMLPFNIGGSATDLGDVLSGSAFTPPASSTFTYGRLDTSQTSLLWKFLQRDVASKVVQAPKLLALDNQEATVFVGETIRYARTTAATNQNGGLQFSVEEDPNSPVSVGFQLLVLPHVIPGEDKIMLTVIPQRRALSGKTSPLPGFDRIAVGGQFIDLPRVQSSTLVTHMILRSGQTAVIGGLLEDREQSSADKVPLFGDLPIIGLLFQGKENTKVKEHLLITITPQILKGSDSANCTISDELIGRREAVSAEYSDLSGRAASCDPNLTGASAPSAAPARMAPSLPQPVVRPAPPSGPLPVAPTR